jgi:hypothetical protein
MVSSDVHPVGLSRVVTTTELKSVSLGFGRFETWARQEVCPTSFSHVVITTESKSVSLGAGSKPAGNIFTVHRTEL